MVNIPLFIGFHTSQVVQDFSHQQYVSFKISKDLIFVPGVLIVDVVGVVNLSFLQPL